MLAAGSEHLAVLDGERICGMLSATDLLGLDARSPIALRHVLLGASDEDALVRAAGEIPKLFLLLARAGVPPRELGRVLSLQHDTVVERLIDFSIAQRGPAPVGLELARPGQRGPPRVHARLRPGQRAGLRRSGTRGRRRRWTATSRSSGETSTTAWSGAASASTTTACSPATASGACPSATGCATFDELDARARRVAPDPGHGVVRLPLECRRADDRAGADRADARRASPRPVHAPDGAYRDRLSGGARVPRPAGHRARRRSAGKARPQARRDHPARQPGPFPRPGRRGDDLATTLDRIEAGGQRRRARSRRRRRRCARRSR